MLLTHSDREHIKTASAEQLREDLTQARRREDQDFASAIAHELIRRTNPDTHPQARQNRELFAESDIERDRR